MKILDTVLLNLKIISQIKENGRIKRSPSGNISLDNQNKMSWMTRYIYHDSRKRSIDDVSNIIELAIDKCDDIINSKYLEEIKKYNIDSSFIIKKMNIEQTNQYNLLKFIFNELQNCVNGLSNLKKTYSNDITTTSKIDIIISKISNYTNQIDKDYLNIFK